MTESLTEMANKLIEKTIELHEDPKVEKHVIILVYTMAMIDAIASDPMDNEEDQMILTEYLVGQAKEHLKSLEALIREMI